MDIIESLDDKYKKLYESCKVAVDNAVDRLDKADKKHKASVKKYLDALENEDRFDLVKVAITRCNLAFNEVECAQKEWEQAKKDEVLCRDFYTDLNTSKGANNV